LYPQDGSGISDEIDQVVVSAAVEEENPDLKKARLLSLPVTVRSAFLAEIFNRSKGIGVAGSSGKSTITAMAAQVLDAGGLDPTVINGAIMPAYERCGSVGNVKVGKSDYMLVETDESDGSIVSYRAAIGVLANISKDHKPLEELRVIFKRFLYNTTGTVIVNADCPHVQELSARLSPNNVISFGMDKADIHPRNIAVSRRGSTFFVDDVQFEVPVPGMHNVSNALAVIALSTSLGIPLETTQSALAQFQGVARRLQLVGQAGGVVVIDDFSHNPAKISAALATIKPGAKRVVLIYQPHGYGPTRFLRNELAETFNKCLTSEDFLIVLDIYYAGGTADTSISAADLLSGVNVPRTESGLSRADVVECVRAFVQNGDSVVVMGARDPTLTDFAKDILAVLSG
jgi:UDP-N-acetylmuramate--alanine ligase